MRSWIIAALAFCVGVWCANHFDLRAPVQKFDRIISFTWNELKP
jgi:hypothetical protein